MAIEKLAWVRIRDSREELMTAIGRPLVDARQHRKVDQKEGGEKKNAEIFNLLLCTYIPCVKRRIDYFKPVATMY